MKHAIFSLKCFLFNRDIPENPIKNYSLTSSIPSLPSLPHFSPYHLSLRGISCFICFLSPIWECKLNKSRDFGLFCSFLYLQYLEHCLTHRMSSINICWINEWSQDNYWSTKQHTFNKNILSSKKKGIGQRNYFLPRPADFTRNTILLRNPRTDFPKGVIN